MNLLHAGNAINTSSDNGLHSKTANIVLASDDVFGIYHICALHIKLPPPLQNFGLNVLNNQFDYNLFT